MEFSENGVLFHY